MAIFLFLLLIMLFLSQLGLPFLMAVISRFFHAQCLNHLPQISSRAWIASLVCGERLANPLLYKLLIDTSLVHLLVISVGHLQMLSWLFEQSEKFQNLPRRLQIGIQIFRWLLLISFALMSGFHPPVVRALLAEILRSLNQRFRWHWNLFILTTMSGYLALVFQPLWIFSLSLYLPWLCCLGFCIIAFHSDTRHRRRKNWHELLLAAVLIQILLIIPLGDFRFAGVMANAFLMPIFGLFLFPVAALAYLFPCFAGTSDIFFSTFEKILQWLLKIFGTQEGTPLPYFYPKVAWALIISLSVMIQIFYRYRWRGLHDPV